ncbi:IgGFc-binding protein-like [Carettochelys insculpta]|uniref:IgGFc-binding protein-like n=1 Tax=Carettochelys insculpta TaxID=44489 RepID=UPI003EBA0FA8
MKRNELVNGIKSLLPVVLVNGKIRVHQSGFSVTIATDFGAEISYDGIQHIEVLVPSPYRNFTCGLCGTLTGDPSDDFQTPNGTLVTSAAVFATSWHVKGDKHHCVEDQELPSCPSAEQALYSSRDYCGVLKTSPGPFAPCSQALSQARWMENCVYDLCMSRGNQTVLCETLGAYTESCQAANLTVGQWRTDQFCGVTCPENSHYEPCASACPASCMDSTAPLYCIRPCKEGCVCNKGYILSGAACVPLRQCGCTLNGQYHQLGEEVILTDTCSRKCSCQQPAQPMQCQDYACRALEICRVVDGIRGCYPVNYGTCSVFGHPHYTTFDGVLFDDQGACKYTLSKYCGPPGKLPDFTIRVENEHRDSIAVSWTHLVELDVYGERITIAAGQYGQVQVNGSLVNLPLVLASGKLYAYFSGSSAVVQTDFGLSVSYDWSYYVFVSVSEAYSGFLCGLGGDFNGNRSDDFRTPNGTVVPDTVTFANSWRDADSPFHCTAVGLPAQCNEAELARYRSQRYCGVIMDTAGPFRKCNKPAAAQAHLDSCVQDVCATQGSRETLCQVLGSYARQCQSRGLAIESWRQRAGCELICPSNSHYELCGPSCPASCAHPAVPSRCRTACEEGCQCDPGFVLSGTECVPRERCGCTHNGRYHLAGESFWEGERCQRLCRCDGSSHTVQCSSAACAPGEFCGTRKGVYGCHVRANGICWASGLPHYTTFDGKRYDFQGTCRYVFAELCATAKSLSSFRVEVKNENLPHVPVAVMSEVFVLVSRTEIHLQRGQPGTVKVDGVTLTLPVHLKRRGILIYRDGFHTVVQADSGLSVSYDLAHSLFVSLPPEYSSQTCGLCVNLNGAAEDDFVRQNVSLEKDAFRFALAGKSEAVPGCDDGCRDSCPLCEDEESLVQSKSECWVIQDPNGPFSSCHSQIEPGSYLSDCIFDVCVSGGAGSALCESIQTYAAACQRANVTISPWRSESFCGKATRCSCDSSSTFRCVPASCNPGQQCAVKEGKLGCQSQLTTCTVTGDPHYFTFDGAVAHFQGTCAYEISHTCNSSLDFSFRVVAANRNFRNPRVSFIYRVDVWLKNGDFDSHVVLERGKDVLVDNVKTPLPAQLGSRAIITRMKNMVTLKAKDNLEIQFNGRHALFVRVGPEYRKQLCGMCGNFNGVRKDDKVMPSGERARDDAEFGNAWTSDISPPRCKNDTGDTEACTKFQEFQQLCGILMNRTGPFAECHWHESPAPYYESCVYDLCQYGLGNHMLCAAVESYDEMCAFHGVKVPKWRPGLGCGVTCSANSYFDLCGLPCRASCIDLNSPTRCTKPCVAGCFCREGYVLDAGHCVPLSQCGCTLNGQYHQLGEEVILTDTCSRKCSCRQPAQPMQCQDHACGALEMCKVVNGVRGCYPVKFGALWVYGHPHYHIFDGLAFDSKGTCKYTLSKYCGPPGNLPDFTVKVENEHKGSITASWTRLVELDVYGKHIAIQAGQYGQVQVNGSLVNLPLVLASGKLYAYYSGSSVVVQTEFGLSVSYDWSHYMTVVIPETYSGMLCGLGGDFNGNRNNDFRMPNGSVAPDRISFVSSWKDVDSPFHCTAVGPQTECSKGTMNKYRGQSYCGILTDTEGPFKRCSNLTSAEQYVESCVHDLCAAKGSHKTLCDTLRSYAVRCQSHGITIQPWRLLAGCELICPSNSHYELCGPSCPASCAHPAVPSRCRTACEEGCQCDPGFVLSGTECVPRERCGCTHNGRYHLAGESFWEGERCQRLCRCDGSSHTVQCSSAACAPGEFCGTRKGVYGCHVRANGICWASGLPHYTTFDGKRYDFQGTCRYVFAELCATAKSLSSFRVEVKNENLPHVPVAVTSEVFVLVNGVEIHLQRGQPGTAKIDGVVETLPVSINGGEIIIYQAGLYTVVKIESGLSVSYDLAHSLFVSLPPAYQGQTCGLCGNFNGVAEDDFVMRNGSLGKDAFHFAADWKSEAVPGCDNGCRDSCPACEDEERLVQSKSQCWVIQDPSGPFSSCHSQIEPGPYLSDCIFDVCVSGGAGSALCESIQTYAAACQRANVTISPWRNESFCGDPHYFTFDGAVAHFQGICDYEISHTRNSSLNLSFRVVAANRHFRNPHVSFVYRVEIWLSTGNFSSHIVLERGKAVHVNGLRTGLPAHLGTAAKVLRLKNMLTVRAAKANVEIQFNGASSLFVRVGPEYRKQLSGMCGNFNGDPMDDKVLPSGEKARNDTQFGNSWISDTSPPGCTNDTGILVSCPKLHMYQHLCGILTNSSGPFSECHWHESPAPYYESCIYDLCQYGLGNRMLCTAIESYDEICTILGVKMANWRPRTGCSFICPAKNYFDFCGPACPATCANLSAPLLCTKPCVAGCFCREGYVLESGLCVPVSQCGCTLDGEYHRLGKEVILTDTCSRKCSCQLPAQPMRCQDHACGAQKICRVVDGVRGCYPLMFSTSWVFGHLHYSTFDGVMFGYQGVCKYTLSKYCGSPGSLPDFTVQVENEHRGSIGVSWTRLVELDVYGERITVAAGQYGRVQVNGSLVNLPLVLASGKLYAYFSGSSAVLQTDFGLSVSYDWSHSVALSLAEIYAGSVCGLGGDFNGNPRDDFRTPNGSVVADAVTFGDSWRDAKSPFHCTAFGPPAQCNQVELARYRSQQYCGVIADAAGPFQECNKTADAQAPLESCVQDVCVTQGSHETLCQVLGSYARQCQRRGLAIEPWRQRAECELRCPRNSHYELCGPSCPASCAHLAVPSRCWTACEEGCQCDPGFVLSGTECVPRERCGCTHNGRYHLAGESFWEGERCQRWCRCDGSSHTVQCSSAACAPGEFCGTRKGVYGCHVRANGICWASGLPHYTTFDGKRYDFQGTCRYVFAELCATAKSLSSFRVEVKNENLPHVPVAVTSEVFVLVNGVEIHLQRGQPGTAKMAGVTVILPVNVKALGVAIYQHGLYTVLQTPFGLSVSYDLAHSLFVSLPPAYQGQTCGLCGNFNGIAEDDFVMHNGSLGKDAFHFAADWKSEAVPGCDDGCRDSCPSCEDKERRVQSKSQCWVIQDPNGPFSSCHSQLEPGPYLSDCIFDVCVSGGAGSALCESIQTYAAACQRANVSISPWRSESFCDPGCPENSHYKLCEPPCRDSCAHSLSQAHCSSLCTEGCFCNTGYLRSGASCLPRTQCGCVHKGLSYLVGERVWLSGCRERCSCDSSSTFRCIPASCNPGQQCAVKEGKLGCQSQLTTCTVTGDPHYFTFDGAVAHFQGTCAYEISHTCNSSLDFSFRVVAANRNFRNPRVSFVTRVDVWLRRGDRSAHIALGSSQAAEVNGQRVSLPHSLGALGSVSRIRKQVAVRTPANLEIRFNMRHVLLVRVGPEYWERLCGMCGNFNGLRSDDKALPSGERARSDAEFGNAWKAEPSPPGSVGP